MKSTPVWSKPQFEFSFPRFNLRSDVTSLALWLASNGFNSFCVENREAVRNSKKTENLTWRSNMWERPRQCVNFTDDLTCKYVQMCISLRFHSLSRCRQTYKHQKDYNEKYNIQIPQLTFDRTFFVKRTNYSLKSWLYVLVFPRNDSIQLAPSYVNNVTREKGRKNSWTPQQKVTI